MPLIATRGAASAQGFGEFAQTTAPVYIEDVFSTFLYQGNGTTQTITNGIDLSGKGGLVWVKKRSQAQFNILQDTVRGAGQLLYSNDTSGQGLDPASATTFTSTGFITGSDNNVNQSSQTYVSWTFREQPKFFDVVTYTGNGVAGRTVSHNLGSVPGFFVIKRTDNAGDWRAYHRSLGADKFIYLNATLASQTSTDIWNNTAPTATEFTLGNANSQNINGATYVAYLFAHDAGGFGLSGTDNVISCGSFTTDGSGNSPVVNLGYEPQWLLVKGASEASSWYLIDTMRGFNNAPAGSVSALTLYPNLSNAEAGAAYWNPTSTGFYLGSVGGASQTYIYIAIRRGPMKTPTSGTSVFSPIARNGTGSSATVSAGFPADMVLTRKRSSVQSLGLLDRLRGNFITLFTDFDGAEGSNTGSISFDTNAGFNVGSDTGGNICNQSGQSYIQETFLRAPGFFDVVCYTGNGANRTITHNLAAVPELMIVKLRSGTFQWQVYSSGIANTEYVMLDSANAKATGATRWNSTTPTSSVFSLGTSGGVNSNGSTYVAYLFATVAGVSKVGSYTGTGTTQTINCGFTAGSRFVMIKRTDSAGDWYFWDSARGIVAGNDPYLLMNSSGAEVTNTDYVDTANSGFEISSTAPAAINANGGSFIFFAVA
jgi:hypothetical protein